MALVKGEINPLNVLGIRQLSIMPEHFYKISLSHPYLTTEFLEYWIEYNLNSRYSIARMTVIENEKILSEKVVIGFEDEKDLTIFCLSYPHFLKG